MIIAVKYRTQRLTFHVFEKTRKWIINSSFEYLVETDVDTLVVVGVETLDEVDTDEDVE